jgi:type II secretory pathway component HofQ
MNYRPFAIALCLMSLSLPVCALAQTSDAPPTALAETSLPPVSLDLRDASLRQALESLFDSARAEYTLDPKVEGTVTVKFNNVPFDRALEILLKTSSIPLKCIKENGVYIIKPQENPEPDNPALKKMVSLDFKDAPVRDALEQLFRTTNIQFSIDSRVNGLVTLKITDQPFQQVLHLLLRTATEPLKYIKRDGIFVILPRFVDPLENDSLITLDIREGEIMRVLKGVFDQYKKNSIISPEVSGKITLSIKEKNMDEALRAILSASSGQYTFENRNGVYYVYSKNKPSVVQAIPITLKAEVVTVSDYGKRTTLLAAISRGNTGTVMRASDKTTGPPSQTSRVTVSLDTVMVGNELDVTSTWDVSLPLTGTKGGIIRLDKSLTSTLRLKPGETIAVGGTIRNQYGLKDEVLFFLTWEQPKNPGATRVSL